MQRGRYREGTQPVAKSLTDERWHLPLEDAADPMSAVDGPDDVERSCVQPGRHVWLRLKAWRLEDMMATVGQRGLFWDRRLERSHNVRIRTCSTGPETTELARPATAPDANSWAAGRESGHGCLSVKCCGGKRKPTASKLTHGQSALPIRRSEPRKSAWLSSGPRTGLRHRRLRMDSRHRRLVEIHLTGFESSEEKRWEGQTDSEQRSERALSKQ